MNSKYFFINISEVNNKSAIPLSLLDLIVLLSAEVIWWFMISFWIYVHITWLPNITCSFPYESIICSIRVYSYYAEWWYKNSHNASLFCCFSIHHTLCQTTTPVWYLSLCFYFPFSGFLGFHCISELIKEIEFSCLP